MSCCCNFSEALIERWNLRETRPYFIFCSQLAQCLLPECAAGRLVHQRTDVFFAYQPGVFFNFPAQLFVLPAGVSQEESDSALNGISLHDVVFNGFKVTVQVEAFADGQRSGNTLERVQIEQRICAERSSFIDRYVSGQSKSFSTSFKNRGSGLFRTSPIVPSCVWSTSRMTDRPNIWSHKKGSEIKTFPRAGTTWFVSILNRFILLYMPLIYIIFHNKPKFFAVFHFKSFFSQILWLFLFGENT